MTIDIVEKAQSELLLRAYYIRGMIRKFAENSSHFNII